MTSISLALANPTITLINDAGQQIILQKVAVLTQQVKPGNIIPLGLPDGGEGSFAAGPVTLTEDTFVTDAINLLNAALKTANDAIGTINTSLTSLIGRVTTLENAGYSTLTLDTTGSPSTVGTASSWGASIHAASASHQHAHGTQPLGDGTNHAVVTTSFAGFMSAADKTKLNGIASGATADSPYTSTPNPVGVATAGSSGSWARGDHIHAHGMQPLGDGTDHALATDSFAGFLSSTSYGVVKNLVWDSGSANLVATGFRLPGFAAGMDSNDPLGTPGRVYGGVWAFISAGTIGSRFQQIADGTVGVFASDGATAANLRVATPLVANDAANKGYVDATAAGLQWKQPARVTTTANITLSGTQTIDGVSVVANDRVLVKDQSTASENGIYVVASGVWSRSTDGSTGELNSGAAIFVSEGSTNADTGWTLTTNDPIVIGTTALTFVQFTSLGQVIAGAGLSKSGNTIQVATSGDGSIVTGSGVAVGVLASDAQHGTRGGGTLHSAASHSAAGFMSATDKQQHDWLGITSYSGTTLTFNPINPGDTYFFNNTVVRAYQFNCNNGVLFGGTFGSNELAISGTTGSGYLAVNVATDRFASFRNVDGNPIDSEFGNVTAAVSATGTAQPGYSFKGETSAGMGFDQNQGLPFLAFATVPVMYWATSFIGFNIGPIILNKGLQIRNDTIGQIDFKYGGAPAAITGSEIFLGGSGAVAFSESPANVIQATGANLSTFVPIRMRGAALLGSTPASSSDPGIEGEVRADGSYIYRYTSGAWGRTPVTYSAF